jgi:hypothetical protein
MTDDPATGDTGGGGPDRPAVPLSIPGAADIDFGRLDPLRVGLAMTRLSRITGVPVEILWSKFAETCRRRDAGRGPTIVNAQRRRPGRR